MSRRFVVAAAILAAAACSPSSRMHTEHAHHGQDWLGDLVVAVAANAVDAGAEAAFDRTRDEPDESESPSSTVDVVPVVLDRDLVAFALDPARPALAQCGASVTISVAVSPEGQISQLEVPASPDVRRCVAAALRDVRFVATVRGGRFRYAIRAAS
jgi:hypothetical protein